MCWKYENSSTTKEHYEYMCTFSTFLGLQTVKSKLVHTPPNSESVGVGSHDGHPPKLNYCLTLQNHANAHMVMVEEQNVTFTHRHVGPAEVKKKVIYHSAEKGVWNPQN